MQSNENPSFKRAGGSRKRDQLNSRQKEIKRDINSCSYRSREKRKKAENQQGAEGKVEWEGGPE